MFISLPTFKIDGQEFSIEMAQQTDANTPSQLQVLFRERYGMESFLMSLANFLAEWFNGEPILKVHTSGSTGKPKELWVEKQKMVNSAQATISFLGLKKNDSALLCMPLPYIAGKMVVVRALVAGLNIQVVTPCGHPFGNIQDIPTFAAVTPMQVYNSLQNPDEFKRIRQVKNLIIGGGAVDQNMAAILVDFPNAVWSTYGMTETLSHIALRRLNGKSASDWYTPFENVHVSLSNEGTLVIQAPKVCSEILYTNDIVSFNEKGQFKILGRKDNTINTGGIKVQIEEVENSLYKELSLPFMITSVPDPKFGEQIVLLLEENSSHQLSHETELVIQNAINKLPVYWRPKSIIKVSKLPLTGTGKPDRASAKIIALKEV